MRVKSVCETTIALAPWRTPPVQSPDFDVSEGSGVWWRLTTEVLPQQVRSAARLYERMPKASPTKLRLL